jgi:hypothetical protein
MVKALYSLVTVFISLEIRDGKGMYKNTHNSFDVGVCNLTLGYWSPWCINGECFPPTEIHIS